MSQYQIPLFLSLFSEYPGFGPTFINLSPLKGRLQGSVKHVWILLEQTLGRGNEEEARKDWESCQIPVQVWPGVEERKKFEWKHIRQCSLERVQQGHQGVLKPTSAIYIPHKCACLSIPAALGWEQSAGSVASAQCVGGFQSLVPGDVVLRLHYSPCV